MPDLFFQLLFLFHFIALFCILCAMYFAIKLYKETDKGWYWGGLLFGVVFYSISQILTFLFPTLVTTIKILPLFIELAEIIGAILLGVSFYGMHKTMNEIRKRIE